MRARSSLLALSLSWAVGLSLGACRLPNPDHCFNRAEDPDRWCAEQYGDAARGICSPCAYEDGYFGCVEDVPVDCALYTSTETGSTETGG